MAPLFVDQEISIHAPAEKVWEVLTRRKYTDFWAHEFSSGGPQFHLESDWNLGDPVFWKGEDGTIFVKGNVTALTPFKLLRFTVFDVRGSDQPQVTEKDGITYQLHEEDGNTHLHVLQGDFSVMDNGEKYYLMTVKVWEKVLPKVKQLAEDKE